MNSKQRRQNKREWKYRITYVVNVFDDDFYNEWPAAAWCDEKVGKGNWRQEFVRQRLFTYYEYSFHFKNEKDAMVFALRWS